MSAVVVQRLCKRGLSSYITRGHIIVRFVLLFGKYFLNLCKQKHTSSSLNEVLATR